MTACQGSFSSGSQKPFCRCKKCCATKQRISVVKKKGADIDGWTEVSGQSRQDTMKKAHELFGNDLAKLIHESVTKARLRRQTISFTVDGQFEKLEDVKERLKDQPERLANILQNAERITCEVTKDELVALPKYKLSSLTEDQISDERKRKIETEETIKKVARPKMLKDDKDKINIVKDEEAKQILPGKLKTMEAKIQKMSGLKLVLDSMLLKAKAPELADDIPKNVIKKAEDCSEHLSTPLELGERLLAATTATKTDAASFEFESKTALESGKEAKERLIMCSPIPLI